MRGLIAFTLLIPLLLGLTGCERAKTKLDREVDRLCAIDGGVHIYETVTLSKENFGPNGEVFPQYRGLSISKGRYGPDYTSSLTLETIRSGSPGITRIHTKIVRNLDGKTLGEIIDYKRSGGDFPGPWEPSHHSCGLVTQMVGFERRIFQSERE